MGLQLFSANDRWVVVSGDKWRFSTSLVFAEKRPPSGRSLQKAVRAFSAWESDAKSSPTTRCGRLGIAGRCRRRLGVARWLCRLDAAQDTRRHASRARTSPCYGFAGAFCAINHATFAFRSLSCASCCFSCAISAPCARTLAASASRRRCNSCVAETFNIAIAS